MLAVFPFQVCAQASLSTVTEWRAGFLRKKAAFFFLRRDYCCQKHIWIQISATDKDSRVFCALFSAFNTGHCFQRSAVSLDVLHQQQHVDKRVFRLALSWRQGGNRQGAFRIWMNLFCIFLQFNVRDVELMWFRLKHIRTRDPLQQLRTNASLILHFSWI